MATAQTPTQPAAGPIAKVLQDRFGTDYILNMEVVYESPKMVVLKGNFLTVVRDYNTAFWKAIELLENEYGFNMDKFAVNGLGSEANPERFYAVMTKTG